MRRHVHPRESSHSDVSIINTTPQTQDPQNADFWEALAGEMDVTDSGEDDDAIEKAAGAGISLR